MVKKKGKKYIPFDLSNFSSLNASTSERSNNGSNRETPPNVSSDFGKTRAKSKKNSSTSAQKNIKASNILDTSSLSINSNSTEGINTSVQLSSDNLEDTESANSSVQTDQNASVCYGAENASANSIEYLQENDSHTNRSCNTKDGNYKKDYRNVYQSHSRLQGENRSSVRIDDDFSRGKCFDKDNSLKSDSLNIQNDPNISNVLAKERSAEQQEEDDWNDPFCIARDNKRDEHLKKSNTQYKDMLCGNNNFQGSGDWKKGNVPSNFESNSGGMRNKTLETKNSKSYTSGAWNAVSQLSDPQDSREDGRIVNVLREKHKSKRTHRDNTQYRKPEISEQFMPRSVQKGDYRERKEHHSQVFNEKQKSQRDHWDDTENQNEAGEQLVQKGDDWDDETESHSRDFSGDNHGKSFEDQVKHLDSNKWDNENYDHGMQKSYADSHNWTPRYDQSTSKQEKSDQDWSTKNSRRSFPPRSCNENNTKRYSEETNPENYKQNWPKGNSKLLKEKDTSWREKDTSWREKNSYDRRSESSDTEYKKFWDEEKKTLTVQYVRVQEIQKDLFEMPKEYSLGHCVAEDMRMGSGIAVHFKREFRDLQGLLNQRQKQGGLAIIEDQNDAGTRYIYYLVTKRESTGKPTYEKFWSSLKKMRDHIGRNNVKKLAIPRLGCGLDRLEWSTVKHMIEFLFRDVDVEITVCNFQQTEESPEKPLNNTCKVVNVQKSIADIEEETLIIYLSTEDGFESREMGELSKKFSFLADFKRARRQLGEVVKYNVPNKFYILYGCIVKQTNSDLFDFVSFHKCLTQINNNNRKDSYVYVGIQAIRDSSDDLLMEKIITMLKNYLRKVDVYVCWDGDLVRYMPLSYRDS